MYDKCKELDDKIEHYRGFLAYGLDVLTTDRIQQLVNELQQNRDLMHPSPMCRQSESKEQN